MTKSLIVRQFKPNRSVVSNNFTSGQIATLQNFDTRGSPNSINSHIGMVMIVRSWSSTRIVSQEHKILQDNSLEKRRDLIAEDILVEVTTEYDGISRCCPFGNGFLEIFKECKAWGSIVIHILEASLLYRRNSVFTCGAGTRAIEGYKSEVSVSFSFVSCPAPPSKFLRINAGSCSIKTCFAQSKDPYTAKLGSISNGVLRVPSIHSFRSVAIKPRVPPKALLSGSVRASSIEVYTYFLKCNNIDVSFQYRLNQCCVLGIIGISDSVKS
jgi:hypothetical protein